jgi:hypothetical protein
VCRGYARPLHRNGTKRTSANNHQGFSTAASQQHNKKLRCRQHSVTGAACSACRAHPPRHITTQTTFTTQIGTQHTAPDGADCMHMCAHKGVKRSQEALVITRGLVNLTQLPFGMCSQLQPTRCQGTTHVPAPCTPAGAGTQPGSRHKHIGEESQPVLHNCTAMSPAVTQGC